MNNKEDSTEPVTEDKNPDKIDNIQDSEENVSNDSADIENAIFLPSVRAPCLDTQASHA